MSQQLPSQQLPSQTPESALLIGTHRDAGVLHARRQGEGAQQVPGDVGGRVVAEGVPFASIPPTPSPSAPPALASSTTP